MKSNSSTRQAGPRVQSSEPPMVEILTDTRALFIILAATFLIYSNSLGGQFVFDDTKQIVGNAAIRSWSNILQAFSRDVWDFQRGTFTRDIPPPYYRPLFTIYLTVGFKLFGLWEPGWHLMNLFVHLGATVLVFFLIKRLAGDTLVATAAALLFGVHPAHVESVSWISGIPDPLAALFYIPAFILYLRYSEEGKAKWLWLSLLSFGLAALCKETALCLPFIIFVHSFFRSRTSLNQRILRGVQAIIPYVIVAGIYLIARFAVLGKLSWKHPMMADVSDASIVMTVPYVVASYVRHLTAPINLSLIYGTSFVQRASDPRLLLSLLFLTALTLIVVLYRRRLSSLFYVGLSMTIAPLIPVLNLRVFHYEYIIQDRYLYLPSIGFCFLIALGFRHLAKSSLTSAVVALVLLSCAFGASTVLQNRVWHDAVALWQRATSYSPDSWSTHYNLGLGLLNRGEFVPAREELALAARLNPSEAVVFNNLALAEAASGDKKSALSNFERAISIDPKLFEAYNNLGAMLFDEGDYNGAKQQFSRALSLDPLSASTRFNLARTLATIGDHASAVSEFDGVLRIEPGDSEAHYRRGLSLAALGRTQEANSSLERALRLESDPKRAEEIRRDLERISGAR